MITDLYSPKDLRVGKHAADPNVLPPLTPDTAKHRGIAPVAETPEPTPAERYAAFHNFGVTR